MGLSVGTFSAGALTGNTFSNIKREFAGPGMFRVTGKINSPSSYNSGGETITNDLWFAATGTRRIINMQIAGGIVDTSTPSVQCVFDHTPTTGNQGKLKYIAGIRAHSHGGAAPDAATVNVLAGGEAVGTADVSAFDCWFSALCS